MKLGEMFGQTPKSIDHTNLGTGCGGGLRRIWWRLWRDLEVIGLMLGQLEDVDVEHIEGLLLQSVELVGAGAVFRRAGDSSTWAALAL